jgi:hypothetical protein
LTSATGEILAAPTGLPSSSPEEGLIQLEEHLTA